MSLEEKYLEKISELEDRAIFLEKRLNQIKNKKEFHPILVFIHGIIGAGKSTLGHAVATRIEGAHFMAEPITVKYKKNSFKKISFLLLALDKI